MDKPKAAPRKGSSSKATKKNRKRSTSSESNEVQEIEGIGEDSEPETPERGKAAKSRPRSGQGRPRSGSGKQSKSRNTTTGGQKQEPSHSSQPIPGSSLVSGRPPSGSAGRKERLQNRQREETLSVEDDEDLQTSDVRRQVDRLERDLSRRDRELDEERVENERCMDRIKKLERDKVELKREVEGLRDETEEYKRTLEDYKDRSARLKKAQGSNYAEGSDLSEDDIANHNHFQSSFELSLVQKNKEIEQLIEDNERSEEDKKALQEKLTTLKDSLTEATSQIESMAQDHFNLQSKIQRADERIKQLEEDNTVLSIRERELVGFKERHEQYLENLCNAVDLRVDVWKKMMFDKDEEIERLNTKISALMSQIPNTQMDSERSTIQQLNRKLMEREQQITLLNEKLAQATEEIESNIRVIENFQSKINLSEDTEKTERMVRSLQSKVQRLEEKLERKSKQLESVEHEAEMKSKELTSLLSRMHAYESGQYGLPEAVAEIKDLKLQIKIRDKQIESVTQEINLLHMQVSDLQDENEMFRDNLGLDTQADVRRDTKRYTRNRKNELTALRSKVSQLEEEVVTLKSRNYSLKKQVNEIDSLTTQQQHIPSQQQQHFVPERERDRPDGGSVSSPKPGSDSTQSNINHADIFRGMTGLGVRVEEWKEKYEIILEENAALRRGLHEILDCMQKMTDDGSADVMIQAPVLEELLREMSARGIINYPFPITSFHMKVCNLEGKCSQLREELHRVRLEEKQCRNELTESQVTVKILQEKLKCVGQEGSSSTSDQPAPEPRPRRPQRSRSRSPSNQATKKVSFDRPVSSEPFGDEADEGRKSSLTNAGIISASSMTGRNLVLEDLQQEIEYLRSQNEMLKAKFGQERSQLENQVQSIISKANDLLNSKKEDSPDAQRKVEFLQAIRDNQANEITSLIQRLAELENENSGRVGHLERFKIKALHQLSVFQHALETSVPIHLLHSAKKELRTVSDELVKLQSKDESNVMKAITYHKNAEEMSELRAEREKLEDELGKCQARLIETAAHLESVQEEFNSRDSPGQVSVHDSKLMPPSSPTVRRDSSGDTYDLSQKLNHTVKMNNLLKSQVDELESSKRQLDAQIAELKEKYAESLRVEKELNEKTLHSVSREEYDLLASKLSSSEETLVLTKDEMLKWKEIAEMTQNQIRAIENIKDFERMEYDLLIKEVSDLQATSMEKSLLAKAHRQLLSADKEKHLAIQQVQKLLSKLAQIEAYSLQQDKLHQEREMALISMHTQVIMRYRSLFSTLHEMNSPKYFQGRQSSTSLQSQDLQEAFVMFERGLKKCSEFEEQVLEEKLKVEELEQKCETLQDALNAVKDGSGQEVVFESMQKVQEARVEVARWKRKTEQTERECASLKESVHRLASKANDLEEDRIRLEHTLELKDSLTSALMAKSIEGMPIIPAETLSSTSIPLLTSSSTKFEILHSRASKEMKEKDVQTDQDDQERNTNDYQNILEDKAKLEELVGKLKICIVEMESNLKGKDELISELKTVRAQQDRESQRSPVEKDLKDALMVARETITSLQERLKSKEDSVNQYRKLLADVRTEMTNATDRHVQEMKALQMTIHQQQQAFTRMKSTLSQPVRDSANVEGTIKDQLTRIHELEDEVNELQHAMSNTASQLTAARSEAHRWRCVAEARIKEVDSARDQNNAENMEEIHSLRQELREVHKKLEESQQQLINLKSLAPQKDSMTELVNVLRSELEEKDKQIDAYGMSLHELKNSAKHSEKGLLEEELNASKRETEALKEEIAQHLKTISTLNVKVSKTKAINYKTGASAELEDLRLKHRELMDEKSRLERELQEFQTKRDEEEQKRIKTAESVARWEESKAWKKKIEKVESRIRELELENDKTKRTLQSRVISLTRLEKEKLVLEAKLNSRNQRGSSISTADRFSDSSSLLSMQSSQQTQILAQGEIARLNMEIQDLKELCEKTEFEGREEAEKLKMEVRLLKERIVTQERQLTAYQIAQKGDNKAVSEIEGMAARESQLQKEIRRLEEDNLHLNLQIEQLRLDTPRLRDRVQHLQRLVDALKAEKPITSLANASNRTNSQKSLGELEKTINALKVVIDKLQSENKKLKSKPHSGTLPPTASSERLKTSMDSLLEEKKELLDKVHSLEHETEKLKKHLLEAGSKIETIQARLTDAEKRAQSAEMKLRTFLGEQGQPTTPHPRTASSRSGEDLNIGSSYEALLTKMRMMQEELENKNRLLKEAKQSLKAAKIATAPKTSTFQRPAVPPIEESLLESDA